jgi:hypothetical protein
MQVHLVEELCDILQRVSRALPCDRDAGQQQQQQPAATNAAEAGADTPTWMLPAAELVLQCLYNMATMESMILEQSDSPITAGSGNAQDSSTAACWLAAKELTSRLEAQLDSDSSAYSSISGLVQLVKTRLGSNA